MRVRSAMGTVCAIWIAGVGLAAYSSEAMAEGSAEAGKAKSVTCAACHGADGNSVNSAWPSIAGQHSKYTVTQLRAFKSGSRENVLMSSQAMPLSEEDMADLAAYFAAQKPSGRQADPALLSRGQKLYRGGNKETGMAACIACHGPNGSGNPGAGYPSVKGQHADYTAAQLKAYRSGERNTDPNQMMRTVSKLLTDDDIAAIASYVQGLR